MMKKHLLVLCLCLLAVPALAQDTGQYDFVWIEDSGMPSNLMEVCYDKIDVAAGDIAGTWTSNRWYRLPEWYVRTNTNRTGHVLCLDYEKPNSPTPSLKWTHEQMLVWKQNQLGSYSNKVGFTRGDSEAVLTNKLTKVNN